MPIDVKVEGNSKDVIDEQPAKDQLPIVSSLELNLISFNEAHFSNAHELQQDLHGQPQLSFRNNVPWQITIAWVRIKLY